MDFEQERKISSDGFMIFFTTAVIEILLIPTLNGIHHTASLDQSQ